MRLQLFEGVTPRSSVLETTALTTTLADYTLNISDVDAATIGSYDDLSVRFQGYSSEGTPAVFEVDQLWLETPEAAVVPPSTVFPQVVLFASLTLTCLSATAGWRRQDWCTCSATRTGDPAPSRRRTHLPVR